jgi:hypothetical protein
MKSLLLQIHKMPRTIQWLAVTAAVLATGRVMADDPGKTSSALAEVLAPLEPEALAGLAFVRGIESADSLELALASGGQPREYKLRAEAPQDGLRMPADALADGDVQRLVRHAVQRHSELARECWDRVHLAEPHASGTLILQVELNPSGMASHVGVVRDSVHNPRIAACTVRAFSQMQLAASLRDRVLTEVHLRVSAGR